MLYLLFYLLSLIMCCPVLSAEAISEKLESASTKESKVHLVVAMPFRPNLPFDPHWYTPEYVGYIATLCLLNSMLSGGILSP